VRRYQKKRKRRPNWGPFQPGTLPRPDGSLHPDEVWLNDAYQVLVTWFDCPELGVKGMRWLSIKRRDRKPLHDWRELQAIKNELCGEDCEAVELYPSEARLTDSANQYHLFVLPKGCYWPFGYFNRLVSTLSSQGSVQRPFAPHVRPKDLETPQQLAERECRPLAPDQEGITCDWGGCHAVAVAERFSTTHGWLPVCEACRAADIRDIKEGS
jgi:hypothetical protein